MSKVYIIGEKNGKMYVAHTSGFPLEHSKEITKAEYRRHRASGVPSWGEEQTAKNRELHRDPKRAMRWAMRAAKARKEAREKEDERMRNWAKRQVQAVTEQEAMST